MIFLTKSSIFIDPDTGETAKVYQIPDKKQEMVLMDYYVLGSHIYKFVGDVSSVKDTPCGSIYILGGIYCIKEYDNDEDKIKYGIENIKDVTKYINITSAWKKASLSDVASSYIQNEDNIMDINRNKLINTGDVFIPELKETDDPMERIIKLMILNIKPKLNEKRTSFDSSKAYWLDNIRSALNGATKNMSVPKFLMWCELFNLDWEFSVINSMDGVMNPLSEPVTISNKKDLWVDIPEEVPKGIFYANLVEGEDPLKRLIKVAIWNKQLNLRDYKQKGSTSHLINNMRSGLKGKQKMSIPCMLNWCEVLDLIFIIKITNPETGVWYKSVGYDVYTNVPDDENAIYIVDEKG